MLCGYGILLALTDATDDNALQGVIRSCTDPINNTCNERVIGRMIGKKLKLPGPHGSLI